MLKLAFGAVLAGCGVAQLEPTTKESEVAAPN